MDLDNLWNSFLNNLEGRLSDSLINAWFASTKLYKLENGVATVIVPMSAHKEHLKKNFEDIMTEIFTEIAGSNFKFDFILEEEADQIKTLEEINTQDFNSNLNPKYTFDAFVVGDTNKFARTMALSVANKPGNLYNPLFLYANSGLGKTHLMHAIGNHITKNTNKRVLYVTSEQFVADFITINKKNEGNNFDTVSLFKKKYRDVDVLMIDDIQYLGNASQTQEEFFNTFNELHNKEKQIIISSDRSPDDLKLLENRLRTRFTWGLTIKIDPPDMQLRLDIINNKIEAQLKDGTFPQEVKEYIASNCTSDVRKLEGAITRVFAYATMMSGSDITIELAMEALKDYFTKSIIAKSHIEQVQQLVAKTYNISLEDLKGRKRNAKITVPRQIAMYICRVIMEESLTKIGIEFGGKDHTTVMHSVDKIAKEIKNNEEFAIEIEKLINSIK